MTTPMRTPKRVLQAELESPEALQKRGGDVDCEVARNEDNDNGLDKMKSGKRKVPRP